MAEQNDNSTVELLNTLLFPMQRGMLVLPDIAVAEIVDYKSVTADDDCDADWYLGQFNWRDIDVPLVCFDRINGDEVANEDSFAKIVVINSVSERDLFPYWAFVINESPRMQNINEAALVQVEDADLGEMTAMRAEIQGEAVILPDLEKIEAAIVALDI